MNVYNPFSRPMYIMLKPAGPLCNLRCHYCYYLEKRTIYGGWGATVITDSLLEKFVKDYIEAQTTNEVLFTWHGGETLLRSIPFYQRALDLQRKYAQGKHIDNCIQTNGIMITEEWCRFFKDNGFLVGVSIDGTQEMHDRYRRTASDEPSFNLVMRGIDRLNKYGVEWNALATVNAANVCRPLDFYHFFKDIGCHYIQMSPIVERHINRPDGLRLASGMQEGGELTDYSISAQQWGDFLCDIFDEWVRQDVGEYYIQLFDATLANWVGEAPGVCVLGKECGHVGVMEYNGDVYSCDHFVYPEHRLGNLRDMTITEMMYSQKQNEFARIKSQRLPQQCKECQFLFACHGECPKNRFIRDQYGQTGLNYLCQGYHRYFSHVAPYMDFMANELRNGRAPANVMGNL